MKKYIAKATKWLAACALISFGVFAAGIILIVVDVSNIKLQIGTTMLGGLLSILFTVCFFAERSRYLVIDADRFIFPRGAYKNGEIVHKKTVIKKTEIRSVESIFHKGGKIVFTGYAVLITGDCFFYNLVLKDGTEYTVTLYAYGEKAEKEIFENIKESVK